MDIQFTHKHRYKELLTILAWVCSSTITILKLSSIPIWLEVVLYFLLLTSIVIIIVVPQNFPSLFAFHLTHNLRFICIHSYLIHDQHLLTRIINSMLMVDKNKGFCLKIVVLHTLWVEILILGFAHMGSCVWPSV